MAYKDLARRIKFLIAAWQRHGSGHVAEVFRQDRIRRKYAAAPPPLPEREAFMQRFSWFSGADTFVEDFYRSASLRLPLGRANRKEFFLNLLLSLRSYDDVLTDADAVAEGRFPLPGLSTVEPEGSYNWHRDYLSGKTWPNVPYNRISFLGGDGADVKYPWELSRMYWIAWLGQAYWVTSNEAWSRDFQRLIDHWVAENPVNTGVNWSMPMEVAIRGFWLMMGFGFFYGSRSLTDEWWINYLRTAHAHGTYLAGNLEYFSNLTNHYISNCMGLTALGLLFYDTTEGRRWLLEGRSRLAAELEHQVLPDGVHYERSIPYHGLVLELYLISCVLLQRGGHPFGTPELERIERMAEFTRDYTTPTGAVPEIGDADDGIVMRLAHDQSPYDHRHLLATAGVLFRRKDFLDVAGGYSRTALLLLGSEGFETLGSLQTGEKGKSSPGSALYREGGFAVLRNDRLHVTADVGPIGFHGNNDTLSFTLSGREGPWMVDPGTYCYTRNRDVRNELRATAAHNAPALDNAEIAEFDGLWRIVKDKTRTEITDWQTDVESTLLEARHHAYGDLPKGGVTVVRRWELRDSELRIRDQLQGTGEHDISIRFTVPGECSVEQLTGERIAITQPGGARLEWEASLPISLRHSWYSPGYGSAAPAILLEIAARLRAPAEITYIGRLS